MSDVGEMLGATCRLVQPQSGERYRVPKGRMGGGETVTVQRIVRPKPQVIRSPYVECWHEGGLVRIPLDERWNHMERISEAAPPQQKGEVSGE